MAIRLFVGNLPQNVTEAELREHFSTVGPLSYITIPTDRETGRQRGFAFIEFKDSAQAEEAIRHFNNKSFKGGPLSVKEARARDDRAPSRPALSRPSSPVEPNTANLSANKLTPNFGSDASPNRSRSKPKGRPNSERIPKGPMREVVRGQFFGEDGDDDENEDHDSYDDIETGEESFAGRESDHDSYDDTETGKESFAGRESDLDRNNTSNQSSDLATDEFNRPLHL